MTKYILFSEPQENILLDISPDLFIKKGMKIAYMPSDGSNLNNAKYQTYWEEYLKRNDAQLILINNSLRGVDAENECKKILQTDALILTGGKTFQFLKHLKESGLDNAIIQYSKEDKIIVGFSAGAIILSPTIEIALLPTLDENTVNLSDLKGLGLIEFDVYPHYQEELHKDIVDEYEKNTGRVVKRLVNEEYLILTI